LKTSSNNNLIKNRFFHYGFTDKTGGSAVRKEMDIVIHEQEFTEKSAFLWIPLKKNIPKAIVTPYAFDLVFHDKSEIHMTMTVVEVPKYKSKEVIQGQIAVTFSCNIHVLNTFFGENKNEVYLRQMLGTLIREHILPEKGLPDYLFSMWKEFPKYSTAPRGVLVDQKWIDSNGTGECSLCESPFGSRARSNNLAPFYFYGSFLMSEYMGEP